MAKMIGLDDVVFRKDLYPRLETSAATVQKYNENVLVNAARLAKDSKMSTSQVEELAKDVRREKTESAQIAAVEATRRKLHLDRPQPVVHTQKNVRTKFLGTLTTMENYLEQHGSWPKLQITGKEEKNDVAKRLQKLAAALQKLARAALGQS